MPAGEVAAIEEVQRFVPVNPPRWLERWRSSTCPFPTRSIRSPGGAAQGLAAQFTIKNQIRFAAFFFLRRNEVNLVAIDSHGWQRPRISPPTDKPSLPGAMGEAQFEP